MLWSQLIHVSKTANQARVIPDSKIHGANMGHTWVLPAPGGPHVGPMNLAIRDLLKLKHEPLCVATENTWA